MIDTRKRRSNFESYLGKDERGVTLIELILYVALFIIFLTGVVSLGVQTILMRQKASTQQEVIANTRILSKRIAFEIRNASAVTTITPTSITLASADALRNPTVIAKTGDRVTIGWSGAGACPTSSPCFLTSDDVSVDSLLFANMSDGGGKTNSVKYTFTISKVNPGGRSEWNYTQTLTGNAEMRSK